MITPCKMRIPEEGREEILKRIIVCAKSHGLGIVNYQKKENENWVNITKKSLGVFSSEGSCSNSEEITLPDFLEKYEDKPEYFKLDLSKCDLTERKRLWEIIKKAIPHHGNRVAQYRESGLCSRSVSGKEITWGYFLTMDGKKVVRVEETPSVRNELMLKRDDRPLSKGEQAYADSKVKPEPEQKRTLYIDERPMPYRMGWER